jgi:uncharacterized protein
MYINVAQLLKEPVGSKRNYKVDELIGEEGKNNVRGKVTLIHTNRSVLVQGSMTASVRDVCNRCLETVDFSVNFTIEDEYLPSIDIASGLPLSTNPDSFTLDKNHALDLSEILNQYMISAIPMKLLCRPDCAGLCPACGHNLNEGSCSCPSQTKDPRWSKLVKLKKGD